MIGIPCGMIGIPCDWYSIFQMFMIGIPCGHKGDSLGSSEVPPTPVRWKTSRTDSFLWARSQQAPGNPLVGVIVPMETM